MADKGGLEGVVVARSRLCWIDGQNGVLVYGGYDVGDLAEHSSYEEVCFLTLYGELPTKEQFDSFLADLSEHRELSEETAQVVDMLASHAAPMEMLRTAVSSDSFDDPDKDSNDPDANSPQGHAPDRQDADDGRALRAPPGRGGAGPARPRARARGELPAHADRRAAVPGRGEDVRRRADPARRPRDERVHLHRPGDRIDALGHALRDHRRHRRAEGAAPRRRQRAGRCTCSRRSRMGRPSRTRSTPGSSARSGSWASATASTRPGIRAP